MQTNPHDPVIPIAEAASRMGVNIRRARGILARNGVRPVSTREGVGYRLDDVTDVRKLAQ